MPGPKTASPARHPGNRGVGDADRSGLCEDGTAIAAIAVMAGTATGISRPAPGEGGGGHRHTPCCKNGTAIAAIAAIVAGISRPACGDGGGGH